MTGGIDPEMFRLPDPLIKAWSSAQNQTETTKTGGNYRWLPGEKFLKGPIPLHWLLSVFPLPGKALHVAVALWYRSGLEKSCRVKFNQSRWKGVSRDSARRGLCALERAGLVRVMRHPGRVPIVTIVLNNKTLGRGLEAGRNRAGEQR